MGTEAKNDTSPSDSDHRLETIWADYYITPEKVGKSEMDVTIEYATSRPFQDILSVELHIPNRESTLRRSLHQRRTATEDGGALIFVATCNGKCSQPFITKLQSSHIGCISRFILPPEVKLDRMVPYIVELLNDDTVSARSTAFRAMMQVLMLVTIIALSNVSIFPEYKHQMSSPRFRGVSAVYLCAMYRSISGHCRSIFGEWFKFSAEISYDAASKNCRDIFQNISPLFSWTPSSIVKRAVLHDISSLCIFLNMQKTNDDYLSQ